MVELEVPMDQEEEERIWSAFKQASPTELTGGEEALDKNRILKFRKSEGKGDSRGPDVDMAIAEAAEADKGAAEDKQTPNAVRGRSQPRSQGSGTGTRSEEWRRWRRLPALPASGRLGLRQMEQLEGGR